MPKIVPVSTDDAFEQKVQLYVSDFFFFHWYNNTRMSDRSLFVSTGLAR
jgi:hypothetical protein